MAGFIVDREMLLEHLLARIHSNQVMVLENGEEITLTPVKGNPAEFANLRGMFAGLGMSTEAYCQQKQLDKELE
jgi:hypothetical protein